MNPKTERFELRLDAQLIERIDTWRSAQGDMPSRAEAVRRLVETGLTREATLSPSQSLLAYMLCDIYKHLNVDGEIEPDFIQKAIVNGQFWALPWEYQGIFHDYTASENKLRSVVDILDMYSFIEESCRKMSDIDQKYLKDNISHFDGNKKFHGFDGNNEAEYIGIASFLINDMDRFTEFKGRDLNSHCPMIERYQKFLAVFLPIRQTLMGGTLSKDQIVKVLNAPYI